MPPLTWCKIVLKRFKTHFDADRRRCHNMRTRVLHGLVGSATGCSPSRIGVLDLWSADLQRSGSSIMD